MRTQAYLPTPGKARGDRGRSRARYLHAGDQCDVVHLLRALPGISQPIVRDLSPWPDLKLILVTPVAKNRGERFTMLSAGSSKYIGRVGALAIALGIGGAMSTVPFVASADDSASPSASANSPAARAGDDTAPTHRTSRRGATTRNLPAAAVAQRSADRTSRPQAAVSLPEVTLAPAATEFTAPSLPAPAL